jgi:hypothetical protein
VHDKHGALLARATAFAASATRFALIAYPHTTRTAILIIMPHYPHDCFTLDAPAFRSIRFLHTTPCGDHPSPGTPRPFPGTIIGPLEIRMGEISRCLSVHDLLDWTANVASELEARIAETGWHSHC